MKNNLKLGIFTEKKDGWFVPIISIKVKEREIGFTSNLSFETKEEANAALNLLIKSFLEKYQ